MNKRRQLPTLDQSWLKGIPPDPDHHLEAVLLARSYLGGLSDPQVQEIWDSLQARLQLSRKLEGVDSLTQKYGFVGCHLRPESRLRDDWPAFLYLQTERPEILELHYKIHDPARTRTPAVLLLAAARKNDHKTIVALTPYLVRLSELANAHDPKAIIAIAAEFAKKQQIDRSRKGGRGKTGKNGPMRRAVNGACERLRDLGLKVSYENVEELLRLAGGGAATGDAEEEMRELEIDMLDATPLEEAALDWRASKSDPFPLTDLYVDREGIEAYDPAKGHRRTWAPKTINNYIYGWLKQKK